MDINIKLPYTVDVGEVKKIVENAIRATRSILKEPKSRIGIAELEAERYIVSIQVWTEAHGFQDSKFTLQEKIMNDLKSAKILIPVT